MPDKDKMSQQGRFFYLKTQSRRKTPSSELSARHWRSREEYVLYIAVQADAENENLVGEKSGF